jgi:hypothetical protein
MVGSWLQALIQGGRCKRGTDHTTLVCEYYRLLIFGYAPGRLVWNNALHNCEADFTGTVDRVGT